MVTFIKDHSPLIKSMDMVNINGLTRTIILVSLCRVKNTGLGLGNNFRQMTNMKEIIVRTNGMVKANTDGQMAVLTTDLSGMTSEMAWAR